MNRKQLLTSAAITVALAGVSVKSTTHVPLMKLMTLLLKHKRKYLILLILSKKRSIPLKLMLTQHKPLLTLNKKLLTTQQLIKPLQKKQIVIVKRLLMMQKLMQKKQLKQIQALFHKKSQTQIKQLPIATPLLLTLIKQSQKQIKQFLKTQIKSKKLKKILQQHQQLQNQHYLKVMIWMVLADIHPWKKPKRRQWS